MQKLYLLAILPPEELSAQIDEIRKECSEKFGVLAALKPPVHITLHRPFKMEDTNEKYLYRMLSPARWFNIFDICLENFGSFNVQVIYVHVNKNERLSMLYRKITGIINRNKLDPRETKNGNTAFNPHITIAYRDIPAESFPKMWEEYKDRKFKRSFTADRFTLLKHDGKRWNILKEFILQPEPETLSLF
jgi:2'-5' RNA ligase